MIFHSAAGHALHLCSFVGVYLVCCYPLVIESVDVGVQISLCGPDLSSSHCIPRYEIVSYGKPNLIAVLLSFFTEAAPVTSLPVASCTAFPPWTLSALHRTLQLWCWQGVLHLVGYAFGIYHSFFVFFS